MILDYQGKKPLLHPDVYVAPGAMIIGDVEIGAESSVWFNTVIRGDVNPIRIGRATNIQDGSVLHVFHHEGPLTIGDYITIGHGAVLQACTLSHHILVGMNATVLDHAEIGPETIIAAGCLIPEGRRIPCGVMVMGVPGKVVRELTAEERAGIHHSATNYIAYARSYRDVTPGTPI